MGDKDEEKLNFEQALQRLKAIADEVQKKEVDLDTSLGLLEEGVKLANTCTAEMDSIEKEKGEQPI